MKKVRRVISFLTFFVCIACTKSETQEELNLNGQWICCDSWGSCFPQGEAEAVCPMENQLIYCVDGVSNADGTMTCFEGRYH